MKVKKSLRSCIMALVLCLSLGMSALAYESVTCKSGTTKISLVGSKPIGEGTGTVYMGGSMIYRGVKGFQFIGKTHGAYTKTAYRTILTIHCTKNSTGQIVFDCSTGTKSCSGNKGYIYWSGGNRVQRTFDDSTIFWVKSTGGITQLNVYCYASIVSPFGSGTVFSGDYIN